jgi:hypothetical protein
MGLQMKTIISLTALALVLLASVTMSAAVDLQNQNGKPGTHIGTPKAITIRLNRTSDLDGTKTVRMPCTLAADIIVDYGPNGPQCRFAGNIILPYRIVRYVRR